MFERLVSAKHVSWAVLVLAVLSLALLYSATETAYHRSFLIQWWTGIAGGLATGLIGIVQGVLFYREGRRPSPFEVFAWILAASAFGLAAYFAASIIALKIICGDTIMFC